MASPVKICYDEPDVSWKSQKQWTAYGRWLKTKLFYWETQPAKYIHYVLARVEKEKPLTCEEKYQFVKKLAYKYSSNFHASIRPYKSYYCYCGKARCLFRPLGALTHLEKSQEASAEALDAALTKKLPLSILPKSRKEYRFCSVCQLIAVNPKESRSCKTLFYMNSKRHVGGDFLLGKQKSKIVRTLLIEEKHYELIEICYLTAVIEQFSKSLSRRPKHLNQFFKRYKGFQNVTQQN